MDFSQIWSKDIISQNSVKNTIKKYSEADIAGYLFSRLQELEVAYDDVVKCMLDHIELGGPLRGKGSATIY